MVYGLPPLLHLCFALNTVSGAGVKLHTRSWVGNEQRKVARITSDQADTKNKPNPDPGPVMQVSSHEANAKAKYFSSVLKHRPRPRTSPSTNITALVRPGLGQASSHHFPSFHSSSFRDRLSVDRRR